MESAAQDCDAPLGMSQPAYPTTGEKNRRKSGVVVDQRHDDVPPGRVRLA
jgi:hypothetical protein